MIWCDPTQLLKMQYEGGAKKVWSPKAKDTYRLATSLQPSTLVGSDEAGKQES